MSYFLYYKNTEKSIASYPKSKASELNPFLDFAVEGDLHGNCLKLFNILIEYHLIDVSASIYTQYVKAYTNKSLSKELHLDFLQKIKINPQAKVELNLLGDDFADRGLDDMRTFELYEWMHDQGINFTVTLSNHTLWFFGIMRFLDQEGEYENNWNDALEYLKSLNGSYGFANSAKRFLTAVKDKAAYLDFKNRFYEKYLSHLKLLYSQYNQKTDQLVIQSHAPITLDVLQMLAIALGFKKRNFNIYALSNQEKFELIKSINENFDICMIDFELLNENFKHERGVDPIVFDGSSDLNRMLQKAIYYLTWNANYSGFFSMPNVEDALKGIHFVHGHDHIENDLVDTSFNVLYRRYYHCLDDLFGKDNSSYFNELTGLNSEFMNESMALFSETRKQLAQYDFFTAPRDTILRDRDDLDIVVLERNNLVVPIKRETIFCEYNDDDLVIGIMQNDSSHCLVFNRTTATIKNHFGKNIPLTLELVLDIFYRIVLEEKVTDPEALQAILNYCIQANYVSSKQLKQLGMLLSLFPENQVKSLLFKGEGFYCFHYLHAFYMVTKDTVFQIYDDRLSKVTTMDVQLPKPVIREVLDFCYQYADIRAQGEFIKNLEAQYCQVKLEDTVNENKILNTLLKHLTRITSFIPSKQVLVHNLLLKEYVDEFDQQLLTDITHLAAHSYSYDKTHIHLFHQGRHALRSFFSSLNREAKQSVYDNAIEILERVYPEIERTSFGNYLIGRKSDSVFDQCTRAALQKNEDNKDAMEIEPPVLK